MKIERGMKRYPRGLIMRFFGQMGGPNSPGERSKPRRRTPLEGEGGRGWVGIAPPPSPPQPRASFPNASLGLT